MDVFKHLDETFAEVKSLQSRLLELDRNYAAKTELLHESKAAYKIATDDVEKKAIETHVAKLFDARNKAEEQIKEVLNDKMVLQDYYNTILRDLSNVIKEAKKWAET